MENTVSNNNVTDDEIPFGKDKDMFGVSAIFLIISCFFFRN